MGKREVTYTTPVDNYRHRIGTHENKRNRKWIEKERTQAHNRKSGDSGVSELVLILSLGLVLLAAFYYFFFWQVSEVDYSKQTRGMI